MNGDKLGEDGSAVMPAKVKIAVISKIERCIGICLRPVINEELIVIGYPVGNRDM